jgi:hypothetical protein
MSGNLIPKKKPSTATMAQFLHLDPLWVSETIDSIDSSIRAWINPSIASISFTSLQCNMPSPCCDDGTMNPLQLLFRELDPTGKLLHNYGKSPFLMGKSTISMW